MYFLESMLGLCEDKTGHLGCHGYCDLGKRRNRDVLGQTDRVRSVQVALLHAWRAFQRGRGLGFVKFPFRYLAQALILHKNGHLKVCKADPLVHAHDNFHVPVHEAGTNDHAYGKCSSTTNKTRYVAEPSLTRSTIFPISLRGFQFASPSQANLDLVKSCPPILGGGHYGESRGDRTTCQRPCDAVALILDANRSCLTRCSVCWTRGTNYLVRLVLTLGQRVL